MDTKKKKKICLTRWRCFFFVNNIFILFSQLQEKLIDVSNSLIDQKAFNTEIITNLSIINTLSFFRG